MGDFEHNTNYGYQFVNKDGGVMIVPSLNVEDAIKLKQRVDEMKRQAEKENASEAEYTEIVDEDKKDSMSGTSDEGETLKLPKEIIEAPASTFTNNSEFIWNKIRNAVMKYYKGRPSNLAYIAAVADDWSMLKAREKCQEFVHSCIAIGAIPYEGDKKTYNIYDGMRKKLCGQSRGEKGARYTTDPLPCDYKSWSDSSLKKKISFCDLIAKEFEGAGMFNRFEKRRETEAS